jgi:hypothetical protein
MPKAFPNVIHLRTIGLDHTPNVRRCGRGARHWLSASRSWDSTDSDPFAASNLVKSHFLGSNRKMRRRLYRHLGRLALLGAALVVFCPCAGAQGEPASPPSALSEDAAIAQARALFNEGTDGARRGEWRLALTAFERSVALHPHAVTTYNIGYCERALGRYTRARKLFAGALAENAAHGGGELPDDLALAAKEYLAEVERQIAHAVISISPEGASVLVDGQPLERAVTDGPRQVLWAGTRDLGPAEPAPASTFELQVDPGAHTFVVSKAGYVASVSTRTFEIGAEANVVLTLPLASSAAPGAPFPPPTGGESTETHAGAPSRVPLYIALGVGAAALATGLTAGAVALSIKEKGASHYPQAGTAADVSTVGFIVGGVGAATGALYWWLSLRESAASARQPSASGSAAIGSTADAVHEVRVRPWVGPGWGGLLGTF